MKHKYVVITTKRNIYEVKTMNQEMAAKSALFRGIGEKELSVALNNLQVSEMQFKKDESIFRAGSKTDKLGLVTGGSVRIESNDVWGNRTILSHIGPGQFFAETYAILEKEPMLVDAIANENSTILFLHTENLKEPALRGEKWAVKILTNLLMITARKNLALSGRSFHTSPKTIRGKVLAYLNSVALKEGSRRFDIPFDRQQLADYLNVERSALSKELGKMKREGLILVNKNHFELQEETEIGSALAKETRTSIGSPSRTLFAEAAFSASLRSPSIESLPRSPSSSRPAASSVALPSRTATWAEAALLRALLPSGRS